MTIAHVKGLFGSRIESKFLSQIIEISAIIVQDLPEQGGQNSICPLAHRDTVLWAQNFNQSE